MKSIMRSYGFTLAEIAIVLVIVGLLLGGLLIPLSAQQDSRYITDTQKTLNDIRDALIGYAAANGRLPCPASTTSNGVESPSPPAVNGACTNAYDGFVPAVTLGVAPTDSQGYAIDAWGNRIHYAVTTTNSNAFTSPYAPPPAATGIKGIGIGALTPDLLVCSTSTGATATTCAAGPPPTNLVSTAVAVLFSTGKGGFITGRSNDEIANLIGNKVFVSHEIFTTAGNEFDDIVIWLSPNILYNRMIAAGRLP